MTPSHPYDDCYDRLIALDLYHSLGRKSRSTQKKIGLNENIYESKKGKKILIIC